MGCCGSKPEIKILILGLQNSGKTTTMLRLFAMLDPKKANAPLDGKPPPPTLGQNMESIKIFGRDTILIDMGGEKGFRPYWDLHFPDVAAVVWVLDGADPPHFNEAKETFHRVVNAPPLRHSPFLFLVNKCDLPECERLDVVTRAMAIEPAEWDPHRPFRLLRVSALLGNGVYEAFKWLFREVDRGQKAMQRDPQEDDVVAPVADGTASVEPTLSAPVSDHSCAAASAGEPVAPANDTLVVKADASGTTNPTVGTTGSATGNINTTSAADPVAAAPNAAPADPGPPADADPASRGLPGS